MSERPDKVTKRVSGQSPIDPPVPFSQFGDFNAAVASTSTALDLYEKMLTLHPNRVNPGSLWATARVVKRVGGDL